jgi:hypothetical protein
MTVDVLNRRHVEQSQLIPASLATMVMLYP